MENKNDKQIFNLNVTELEELIGNVFEEKLQHLPVKEKQELLIRKLITLKEITQIFKISKPTVYKWERMGCLPPSIKIGGRVYYYRSEIEELLTKKDFNHGK